jgi:GntR family transcriptional regulator
MLHDRIVSNDLSEGTLLPAEIDLARHFGVSRPVVRQAMLSLVNDGLIERRAGKGTYVRRAARPPFVGWSIGSIEDVLSYSAETKLEVLSQQITDAPRYVAAALQISQKAKVLELRAVRSSKAGRIAYQRNYVPEPFASNIAGFDLATVTLLELIERTSRCSVDQIMQSISAIAANADDVAALQVAHQTPLLQFERMLVSDERGPVEFGITRFRSDHYRHIANLIRDKASKQRWRESQPPVLGKP